MAKKEEGTDKVIVKFLVGHGNYIKGDVAGFDEEDADKLTGGKNPVAEVLKVKAPAETKTQTPAETK